MDIISIEEDEFVYMRDNGGGYCIGCGEEAWGVEPDAQEYTCESCGKPTVYGIEELLISGQLDII